MFCKSHEGTLNINEKDVISHKNIFTRGLSVSDEYIILGGSDIQPNRLKREETNYIKKIGKYLVFHEDNFLGLGEIDKTYSIQPLKVLSERRNILVVSKSHQKNQKCCIGRGRINSCILTSQFRWSSKSYQI